MNLKLTKPPVIPCLNLGATALTAAGKLYSSVKQTLNYIEKGRAIMADTRLRLEDIFDANYYRLSNPDLGNLSDQQALQHFRLYGIQEGLGGGSRPFSQFFDIAFFEANNPTLASDINSVALQNFFDIGLPAGVQFSPNFDLNYYRSANADLASLDNNQLFKHFLTSGLNEGRNFNPLIDINYYRTANPDLAGLSNRELFTQFINIGLNEGRPSLPLFDVGFYRATNPDLSRTPSPLVADGVVTNQELINHFLTNGLNDKRRFSPFFDVNTYLNSNPDLLAAGLTGRQAYDHFRTTGVNEGRRFSQYFDTNYYLGNNPDLRAAGLTPGQAFNHFLISGVNEGRRPSVLYDPVYYLANNPDLAAQQISFREAFVQFQDEGFSQARSASVWFDPGAIAPLLNVPLELGELPINDWLTNADKWKDIPPGGTLTYSFVTTASAPLYEGPESGVSELTPEVKNNIRNMMRTLSQYIPINFVEVPDRPPNAGRIRFMFSDGPNTLRDGVAYAYAYFPSDAPGTGLAGDVHLNRNRSLADFSAGPGSFPYQIILHEIGHALGLKHPFENLYQLPFGKDNNTNTVMTYNDDPNPSISYNGSFAITPMAYDIRALQYLYGTTYYNQGDTVYTFDINNFIGPNQRDGRNSFKQTLWDSGGIDTLNFAALPAISGGYYFNMNEGGQNTTQFALNGSVYSITVPNSNQGGSPGTFPVLTDSFGTTIAFGSLIENLFGSQGDDEIIGNDLANNIAGGAGNDSITSGRGADILTGGDGSDVFIFALGDGSKNPAATNVITDFQPGVDKIGLSLGLPSSSIAITQGTDANAANTLIWVPSTGEYLAALRNIPASSVGFADLIPV
ncbi:MAG: M10 family metallopeptidase [Phormidium sp.]